jgi:hypothetical protein
MAKNKKEPENTADKNKGQSGESKGLATPSQRLLKIKLYLICLSGSSKALIRKIVTILVVIIAIGYYQYSKSQADDIPVQVLE